MHRGALTLAAVAALWALPAFADPAAIPENVFIISQGDGQYLAKDLLLGAKVQNGEGQIIGDIEDLVLNGDNQIEGVIMGVGGFAGFGEKRIAVHLSALKIKNENGAVTVSLPEATKETLDALSAFERKQPAKSLIDRAIEKAKELSAKSTVTAKDAYQKAKEEAAPALERAQEAAKKTYEESVKPALEKAGEATKNAYDAARDTLQQPAAETPTATPDAPAAAETPATESSPAPAETPAAPEAPAAETPAPSGSSEPAPSDGSSETTPPTQP